MKSNLQEDLRKHYELHKDMVFRIAMTYVKNVEDAKDIVQDTFLRLGTYRGSFTDEEHCKRWLIRVCINLSKDYLKSFWRSKCDSSDDVLRKLENIPTVDERDHEILGREIPSSLRLACRLP